MTDSRDGIPADAPQPDADEERLEELADLAGEAHPDFTPRVIRAIERRRLANHGMEFGWFLPIALVRELLTMTWNLAVGRPEPKEDRR